MTVSAEWLRGNSKNENDPTRRGIHSNKRNKGHLFATFEVGIFWYSPTGNLLGTNFAVPRISCLMYFHNSQKINAI